MPRLAGELAWLLLLTLPVPAQVSSRVQEIETARRQRTPQLAPDEVSKLERFLLKIKEKRILERATGGIAGLRIRFGGLGL
jgi:hypothetical protein